MEVRYYYIWGRKVNDYIEKKDNILFKIEVIGKLIVYYYLSF